MYLKKAQNSKFVFVYSLVSSRAVCELSINHNNFNSFNIFKLRKSVQFDQYNSNLLWAATISSNFNYLFCYIFELKKKVVVV